VGLREDSPGPLRLREAGRVRGIVPDYLTGRGSGRIDIPPAGILLAVVVVTVAPALKVPLETPPAGTAPEALAGRLPAQIRSFRAAAVQPRCAAGRTAGRWPWAIQAA
jgi:hypothetical protein